LLFATVLPRALGRGPIEERCRNNMVAAAAMPCRLGLPRPSGAISMLPMLRATSSERRSAARKSDQQERAVAQIAGTLSFKFFKLTVITGT